MRYLLRYICLLDSGASSLSLITNNNIEEWPKSGGFGVIEYDVQDRKELFEYGKRDNNVLLNVKTLKKHHPAGSDIRTTTISPATQGAQLEMENPLFGAFSYKIDREPIAGLFFPCEKTHEIHIQFYAAFEEPELIEDNRDNKDGPGYYYCGIRQKEKGRSRRESVIVLWLFDVFKPQKLVQIRYWDINGRNIHSRPYPIIWGKPNRIRVYAKVGQEKGCGYKFWFNDSLIFENMTLNLSNINNIGYVDFSRKSLTGTKIFSPVIYDELKFGSERFRPIPSLPQIQSLDTRNLILHFREPVDSMRYSYFQCMISLDNVWLNPLYHSGDITFSNPAFALPTFLEPDKDYFLRVRLNNRFDIWGSWSRPIHFKAAHTRPAQDTALPYVSDIFISKSPLDKPLNRIPKEKWFYLNLLVNDTAKWDTISYIQAWLHSPDNRSASASNRGGLYNKKSNYVFSFSSVDTILYARDTAYIQGLKVTGDRYVYIDDRNHIFTRYLRKKVMCAKIKLPHEADTGPWFAKAYVYTKNEESTKVKSCMFILEKERKVNLKIVLVIVLAIIAGVLIIIIKKVLPPSERETVPKTRHEKILEDGIKYIHQHYAKIKTTREIADHVFISDGYFRSLFKQYKNQRLMDYIVNFRIEKAKALLQQTNKNVTEVMTEVGFNDSSYFTKAFKKITGVTPTQYRDSGIFKK
jgi:AraC-like DNA-binding protein